jgi:hypothetical protein
MGLDMYIFNRDNDDSEELYWRKEYDLQELFQNLAVKKGIEFESFNCIKVPLNVEDVDYILDNLEEIEMYSKDYTRGKLQELKFKIHTGGNFYYDSWW